MIVISERDELEAKDKQIRTKMLNDIAGSYKQPLRLNIPNKKSDYNLSTTQSGIAIAINSTGLVSDEEKSAIEFSVKPVNGGGLDGDGLLLTAGMDSVENGNFKIVRGAEGSAVFFAKFSSAGEFSYRVSASVQRKFPTYLPSYLLDELKALVGNLEVVTSNTEEFFVSAKSTTGVQRKEAVFEF